MESRPITVLGISGSLRRGSHNTAALREAGSVAPDDVTVELVSIGDLTRWASRHQESHIRDLVNFITGKYPV